jgi:hypothetical protein
MISTMKASQSRALPGFRQIWWSRNTVRGKRIDFQLDLRQIASG